MSMNEFLKANAAAQRHANLSRRRFLRGVGACVALPAFASIMPRSALADVAAGPAGRLATSATGSPIRMAFVYFPNGAIPATWWPSGEGKDFVLNRTMEPLVPVQKQIQV